MKKWICTSSLFVLFLGSALVLGFLMFMEVKTSYVWWAPMPWINDSMWVATWIGLNVGIPALLSPTIFVILHWFWGRAMWACGKWDTK